MSQTHCGRSSHELLVGSNAIQNGHWFSVDDQTASGVSDGAHDDGHLESGHVYEPEVRADAGACA